MFNTAQKSELSARKRLLVAESELNRQALAFEFTQLRAAVAPARDVFRFGREAYPLFTVAASVLGFLLPAKFRSFVGLIERALGGWALVRSLKGIWESMHPQPPDSGAAPPAETQGPSPG